jgi:CPA2 family monovalent cation:H+ antiporter-2
VILCGCGRIGRPVAIVLEAANLPYIAIESDLVRFRAAREAGRRVLFGDATRIPVLVRTGVERARAVVVTFHESQASERVLRHASQRNRAAELIVSVPDESRATPLVEAGATVVFPENLAAGLALAGQVLRARGVPEDESARIIREARVELTPALGGYVGQPLS